MNSFETKDVSLSLQKVTRKSDYDRWCQMFAEVWNRDLDQTLIFFQGFMDYEDFYPYLAYVENQIVGGCCLDLSGGQAGFYWDFILPKYRKKGYGSEMIKARLDYAKKYGARTAYAQCLQSSIGIYKSCGFKPTQAMSVFKKII